MGAPEDNRRHGPSHWTTGFACKRGAGRHVGIQPFLICLIWASTTCWRVEHPGHLMVLLDRAGIAEASVILVLAST
jgi:hypothetical protein